jgi:hypothetical protein
MSRVMKAVLAIGTVVLSGTIVSAQAPQGAPAGQGRQGGGAAAAAAPLKNLKVFPKNTTQAQIVPTMRAFEGALQVECGHCHVWEGQGNPINDFASDAKPQKDIARAMMRMVDEANATIAAGIAQTGLKPGEQVQKVTCATCHRGQATPQVPQYQPPAPAGRAGGAGAGAPPAGGAGAPAGPGGPGR